MKKGFTLLEMVVALAVFSIVIIIGLNSLLSISAANKKAQAFRVVQDNLNFVLESVSKAIRTGYDYYCGDTVDDFGPSDSSQDCSGPTGGGPSLTFTDSKGTRAMYSFKDNKIQRSFDGFNFESLISDEIEIERGEFYVIGTAAGAQPLVTIGLRGIVTKQRVESATTLQITISQRVPDL